MDFVEVDRISTYKEKKKSLYSAENHYYEWMELILVDTMKRRMQTVFANFQFHGRYDINAEDYLDF